MWMKATESLKQKAKSTWRLARLSASSAATHSLIILTEARPKQKGRRETLIAVRCVLGETRWVRRLMYLRVLTNAGQVRRKLVLKWAS